MSISITCPHCGATGNAPDTVANQQVRCSKCKQAFLAIPNPAGAAVSSPAPVRIDDDDDVDIRKSRRRRTSEEGGFGDFLMFRKLVTPWVIIIFFWIGLLGCLVASILSLVNGMRYNVIFGIAMFLFYLIIAPIIWRVYCEVFIVIFRAYEELRNIRDELRK